MKYLVVLLLAMAYASAHGCYLSEREAREAAKEQYCSDGKTHPWVNPVYYPASMTWNWCLECPT